MEVIFFLSVGAVQVWVVQVCSVCNEHRLLLREVVSSFFLGFAVNPFGLPSFRLSGNKSS